MKKVGNIFTKSKTYQVNWDPDELTVWIDLKPISEGFKLIGTKCYSEENAVKFASKYVDDMLSKY